MEQHIYFRSRLERVADSLADGGDGNRQRHNKGLWGLRPNTCDICDWALTLGLEDLGCGVS